MASIQPQAGVFLTTVVTTAGPARDVSISNEKEAGQPCAVVPERDDPAQEPEEMADFTARWWPALEEK